ncbi:MAG: CTP synthase, partial [Chthoniobacterales bacterium]
TLVPFIRAAGELKTKPTQQSVAKLREIGLQPHVLICRSEYSLEEEVRQKLSLHCNVPLEAVIEACDVDHTIYEAPLNFHEEGLDDFVCRALHIDTPPPDLTEWKKFVNRVINPKKRVRIAVVGKYIELQDAYKSIYESLTHAGASHDCGIDLVLVDAEDIEAEGAEKHLAGVAGVLVPGGFGDRGTEGKIKAARFARESRTPFLGLCLGMQIATIEFARNVCKLDDANSTEFAPDTPHPIIHILEEQKNVSDKGASMRLGSWPTVLAKDSLAARIYATDTVKERHRHRYEFNNAYREQMEAAGFIISGTSPDGKLVELIELRDHPWYLACQYHPEFCSKPNRPHPLFRGFISACLAQED